MATNLINAKGYWFEQRIFNVTSYSNTGNGCFNVGPWDSFVNLTGNQMFLNLGAFQANNNPYHHDGEGEGFHFPNSQEETVAGYGSVWQVGGIMQNIWRLSILPDPLTQNTDGPGMNPDTTKSMWDGTYTSSSWEEYEQAFNNGDEDAASFLVKNMVDVEGYHTIDAQKITISGWDGGTGSEKMFEGGFVTTETLNTGYWGGDNENTETTCIKQFKGTVQGCKGVPADNLLSSYYIANGLVGPAPEATAWGSYLGRNCVSHVVDGLPQTNTNSCRVIGSQSTQIGGNVIPTEEMQSAIDNNEANTNLIELWPDQVKKVVLMDSLGTDENGFGLYGNIVHAYVIHIVGSTMEWDNTISIDFDGEADFVITDEDYIDNYEETPLLD